MDTSVVDWRRVRIFIAFAFGIAWLAALAIYLTGGLAGNPYALPLLAVGYMGAPALANILTRLVTREGWQDLYLQPKFRQGWPYWIITWIAPALFTFAGMAVFFALFPQFYDTSLSAIQTMLESSAEATGQAVPTLSPWVVVITQTITAVLIAPLLNAIPILGEEFGWRAYLQPKLLPLGGRTTMVWMGVIWGLWHAPVIAMGHNYGLEYPGAPWLGILAMTWFTFVLGTFLGWATLRAGSVWPAVIGHGAINGIAAISLFFVQGEPNLLLGPTIVGFIGSLPIALVALAILLSRKALKSPPVDSREQVQGIVAENAA
ncbi:MAG TPA: CPBP family intramembrane glutamic endopeptidase [Anaerolineales bacterium]|nr:CPBP family intramembrane glutamic endopeptidase [Anaerolineales bacterium]